MTERGYPGMTHGFMSIRLFSQRREALEATAGFLTEVLRLARSAGGTRHQ